MWLDRCVEVIPVGGWAEVCGPFKILELAAIWGLSMPHPRHFISPFIDGAPAHM
jgi:hypothetical protein